MPGEQQLAAPKELLLHWKKLQVKSTACSFIQSCLKVWIQSNFISLQFRKKQIWSDILYTDICRAKSRQRKREEERGLWNLNQKGKINENKRSSLFPSLWSIIYKVSLIIHILVMSQVNRNWSKESKFSNFFLWQLIWWKWPFHHRAWVRAAMFLWNYSHSHGHMVIATTALIWITWTVGTWDYNIAK